MVVNLESFFLFKRNNPKYDDRKEITFEKIPFVAKHWETQ